jgi:hypothetical protein
MTHMTLPTLLFIRQVLNALSLNVSDPDFRSNALSMVTALDELDAEIGAHNASDSPGRDLPHPLPS